MRSQLYRLAEVAEHCAVAVGHAAAAIEARPMDRHPLLAMALEEAVSQISLAGRRVFLGVTAEAVPLLVAQQLASRHQHYARWLAFMPFQHRREIADHAGGRLTVLSSPGHGTLVRLEVPLP